MTFFIEDNKIVISDTEMEYRLISDEGLEGIVYKLGKKAVKIYKKYCRKSRLTEKDVLNLSKIKTNRIMLPRERVFNEKLSFNGYTTDLVDSKSKEGYFYVFTMKKLLEEIKKYEEDTNLLTSIGYSLADMTIFNTEVSDGIYFCDPGSFTKYDGSNHILTDNNDELKRFFITQIMGKKLSKNGIKKLTEHFSYDTNLSSMIECENFDENEKMHTFVRKLVNKR